MTTRLSPALRRWTAPALAGTLLLLSACGGGGGYGGSSTDGGGGGVTNPTPVATTSVSLSGLAFTPAAIQVAAGATLTFTNNDGGITHNVVFAGTAITNISDFSSGSKTTVAPTTPGTYTYQCTHHGGMTGSVVVQ